MRVALMAGLVGAALAAPADACPQGARCITMLTAPTEFTSIRSEVVPAPTQVRQISLSARLATPASAPDPLTLSLINFQPAVSYADDLVMPELWATVAGKVMDRLPRYEDEKQFSMVLSPVVVTMPTESTPGLGLSGDF